MISATEQALSGLNSFLNGLIYDGLFTRDTLTIAGVTLPAVGQYHLPASAALLSAKSVPEAIEWAKRAPMQDGAQVEVRQFFDMEDFGEGEGVDQQRKVEDMLKERQ